MEGADTLADIATTTSPVTTLYKITNDIAIRAEQHFAPNTRTTTGYQYKYIHNRYKKSELMLMRR